VASRLKVVTAAPGQQFTVPYRMSQINARYIPMYESLVGHNPLTNQEQPELATAWSVDADGKTWHWTIKKGVPFIKGAQPTNIMFSPKDVVFSWQTLSGEVSANVVGIKREFGPKVNAEIIGDDKLTLHLPVVSLDMTLILSDEFAAGVMSVDHWNAKGGEEGYQSEPIGTGPWSFKSLNVNQDVLLERVNNHWRKTPEFPELQFLFANEASTRLAMLLAKEAHIVQIPRGLYSQAEQAGMKVWRSTQPGPHFHIRTPFYKPDNYVDPATGQPIANTPTGPTKAYDPNDPLRNVKVREAMNISVDRDLINSTFFRGQAFPLVDYFPPWRNDFQDSWAPVPGIGGRTGKDGGWPYPYDADRAKQLLTEAGFPNGIDLTMYAPHNNGTIPEIPDIAESMVANWSTVGIRVKLNLVAQSELSPTWRSRTLPSTMYMTATSLDPICTAAQFFWYESGFGILDHQEVSDFKKQCNVTSDLEARRQLAIDFGTWWVKNYVTVPIIWVFGDAVVDPGVVTEYLVNQVNMGPIRYHEFTKATVK
jgi:ABC-type transport system substrate-binding protein